MRAIAIDLDGVIIDSEPWLVKQLEEFTGLKHKPLEPRTFDFRDGIDISLKDVCANIELALVKYANHITVLNKERTYLGLALLQYYDVKIYFLTARPKNLWGITDTWLKRKFGSLNYTLHLVGSSDHKEKWLTTNKIHTIIEDRLKTVNNITDKKIIKYLVDQPWNLGRNVPPSVIRVTDFYDAVQDYLDLKEITYGA